LRLRSKKIVNVIPSAARGTASRASYDEKDTGFGKLLQRTARFCRNVTVFASRLSKARRQMMLACAKGTTLFVSAIFN
jgi:hypothetical protein